MGPYERELRRQHEERRRKWFRPRVDAAPAAPPPNPALVSTVAAGPKIIDLPNFLTHRNAPQPISIEKIKRAVSRHSNVRVIDIDSERRTADIVRPRQVAMYLAKTLTLRSLPEIGRRFGGRDHTTVIHAVRKIERLIETDQSIAADISAIRATLDAMEIA